MGRLDREDIALHLVAFSGGHRALRRALRGTDLEVRSLVLLDATYQSYYYILDFVKTGGYLYMVWTGGEAAYNAYLITRALYGNERMIARPSRYDHMYTAIEYFVPFLTLAGRH